MKQQMVFSCRKANSLFKPCKLQVRLSANLGPRLQGFVDPVENNENTSCKGLRFHIETYGCQMNTSDSEIVRSILCGAGHTPCSSVEEADVILTNTCAIRENAENKIWNRLAYFQSIRKKRQLANDVRAPVVGILGCMAERLRDKLLEEQSVNFICGPDAYRDIPRLVSTSVSGSDQKAANTQLSLEETYADIQPVREASRVEAFVSIMRGCNNMCSYCIVPFTRGRERSRPIPSIVQEIQGLAAQGVKEVLLLGQNVNSYHDKSLDSQKAYSTTSYRSTAGFSNLFRARDGAGARFADLLREVSQIDPEMRIRFTSPHPKDFPDEVLHLIADSPNICCSLHLPIQSGSNTVLQRMRRGYTREAYLTLVDKARKIIPGLAISSDFITGFCGETDAEHRDTIDLMRAVQFDQAFMFAYSLREKTHAARRMEDDVPKDVKKERLQHVIETFREEVQRKNDVEEIGKCRLVLVEGPAKKSTPEHPMSTGRTDTNKRVVFEDHVIHDGWHGKVAPTACGGRSVQPNPGDYVVVQITQARGHTLRGIAIARTSLAEYIRCQ